MLSYVQLTLLDVSPHARERLDLVPLGSLPHLHCLTIAGKSCVCMRKRARLIPGGE